MFAGGCGQDKMTEQKRIKCSIVDRKNEWELVFNEEGKKNFLQYGTEDVLLSEDWFDEVEIGTDDTRAKVEKEGRCYYVDLKAFKII